MKGRTFRFALFICYTMKFVADVMLGKLARWLRVAGIDVLYNNTIADEELIIITQEQNRVLLTRDRKLAVDKKVKEAIMIDNQLIDAQLKEFFMKTHLVPDNFFTRCLLCNEVLQEIPDKSIIQERVPPFIYKTHNEFSICIKCDKIYWKGTHRDNMIKKFDTIIGEKNA